MEEKQRVTARKYVLALFLNASGQSLIDNLAAIFKASALFQQFPNDGFSEGETNCLAGQDNGSIICLLSHGDYLRKVCIVVEKAERNDMCRTTAVTFL